MKIVLSWNEFYQVFYEKQVRLGMGGIFFIYEEFSDRLELYDIFLGNIDELHQEVDGINGYMNIYRSRVHRDFLPYTKIIWEFTYLPNLSYELSDKLSNEIEEIKIYKKMGEYYVSFKPVLSNLRIRQHFLRVMLDVLD